MGTYMHSTQHRDPCMHTGKLNLVLWGAAESQVIGLMVGRKPQQPVVPHSESSCLIPKEGQQWGKELKQIFFFLLCVIHREEQANLARAEQEVSISLRQWGEVSSVA